MLDQRDRQSPVISVMPGIDVSVSDRVDTLVAPRPQEPELFRSLPEGYQPSDKIDSEIGRMSGAYGHCKPCPGRDCRPPARPALHYVRHIVQGWLETHNEALTASRLDCMPDIVVNDGPSKINRRQAQFPTLGTCFDPARNNFDLLRLSLATVVVFCHCFTLKGIEWEPIGTYLRYGYGGTLAVDCFLVISGFLVTRSLCERTIDGYVLARIIRVVPGLTVVTLVEVFVIGATFTNAGLWTFLTYVGFRHLWNVTVFGLDAQMYSVFPNTSPPWLMNGSLWTIPIECSFYIILPVILLTIGLQRSTGLIFLVSLLAWPVMAHLGLNAIAPGPSLFTNVHVFPFIDLASYFFAGSAAWMARDRLPFSLGLFAMSLIGLYAAAGVVLSDIALKVFLPYIVLYVSLAGGLGTRLKHFVGDLSYGTYLFGFPVALSVITIGSRLSVYATFFITISITLVCAWLSWHYVEQPCLRLKPKSWTL